TLARKRRSRSRATGRKPPAAMTPQSATSRSGAADATTDTIVNAITHEAVLLMFFLPSVTTPRPSCMGAPCSPAPSHRDHRTTMLAPADRRSESRRLGDRLQNGLSDALIQLEELVVAEPRATVKEARVVWFPFDESVLPI